jgi:hypothetical protein
MGNSHLIDCAEVIDQVMEWIGMKWKKSMIKAELRKWFPDLKGMTAEFIISAARKKIKVLYKIDATEYKGKQIEFYESIIRGKAKHRDKLTAAERLDKLLGLENISTDDPLITAQKIREALNKMDNTVSSEENENEEDGGLQENKNNKNEGDSKTNADESSGESIKIVSDEDDIFKDEDLPEEVLEELKNLRKSKDVR